ncbi:hypothetical protein [Aquimarina agarivorans]|uniref:hypothetical protein n=1 Tax=Aquimarina agarivorans TaxID=980584 RepID=UPI000248EA7A|nr:hypothetical protein [Aquimarina agarivorans]
MKKYLIGLSLLITVFSCNNDDDGITIEPPRPRGPQAVIDDEILQDFLNTHAFNDLEFNGSNLQLRSNQVAYYKLIGGALPEDIEPNKSSGKPIIEFLNASDETEETDKPTLKALKVSEGGTEQTLYVLVIRKGEGRPVSRLDDVNISFEGNTISTEETTNVTSFNSESFDTTEGQTGWLRNYSIDRISGRDVVVQNIPGLAVGLAQFNTATPRVTEVDVNGGPTFSNSPCDVFNFNDSGELIVNDDYGIGALFIPSGLGYYNNSFNGIPQYSNLVYSFSVLNVDYIDHDNDGVFSMYEKDENGNYFNYDTDNDGIPNFLDNNDDGDAKLTRDEIVILDDPEIDYDCDGIKTNDNEGIDKSKSDADNNSTPDYLE